MLLTPQIVTNLIVDSVFVFLATVALFVVLDILLHYKPNENTQQQFVLQKRSYLSSTIVAYILMIKIPLFLYFIYTLDSISPFLKGAMCAVGVIGASQYGIILMIIKVLSLYLFGFWVVLHKKDIHDKYQSYLYKKSLLYLVVYILLVGEVVVEYIYFFDIKPNSLVDCCGVVFSPNKTTFIALFLQQPNSVLYGSFYGIYLMIVMGYLLRQKTLYAIANILFIPIALISLIGYFGTYIYELPTHHCPFCLMQKDYYYIGYILYSLLFVGTFVGIVGGILSISSKQWRNSFIALSGYVALVSFYPLFYFWQNHTWLY